MDSQDSPAEPAAHRQDLAKVELASRALARAQLNDDEELACRAEAVQYVAAAAWAQGRCQPWQVHVDVPPEAIPSSHEARRIVARLEAAVREAHEAAAEKHAREAEENARLWPEATDWRRQSHTLRSYATRLRRARGDHARADRLPRTRPRGAGRPRRRRTTRGASASAPAGSDDPGGDDPPGGAGHRWLDAYLTALLERSAAPAGLPVAAFAERVRRRCGAEERQELDRLLALSRYPGGVPAAALSGVAA
jgi:hypothetical protein